MTSRHQGHNGLHFERIGMRRYRTTCDHQVMTEIVGAPAVCLLAGIRLYSDGWLVIQTGYVWDGPSGPSFHTANFMRGSLYHDALYDLMKQGLLSKEWRKAADDLLVSVCAEDGMVAPRRAWVYAAVRNFGDDYISRREPAAQKRRRDR